MVGSMHRGSFKRVQGSLKRAVGLIYGRLRTSITSSSQVKGYMYTSIYIYIYVCIFQYIYIYRDELLNIRGSREFFDPLQAGLESNLR